MTEANGIKFKPDNLDRERWTCVKRALEMDLPLRLIESVFHFRVTGDMVENFNKIKAQAQCSEAEEYIGLANSAIDEILRRWDSGGCGEESLAQLTTAVGVGEDNIHRIQRRKQAVPVPNNLNLAIDVMNEAKRLGIGS